MLPEADMDWDEWIDFFDTTYLTVVEHCKKGCSSTLLLSTVASIFMGEFIIDLKYRTQWRGKLSGKLLRNRNTISYNFSVRRVHTKLESCAES